MKDYEIEELRALMDRVNPKGFCYMGYPIEEIPVDILHKIIVAEADKQKEYIEFNAKFDRMILKAICNK